MQNTPAYRLGRFIAKTAYQTDTKSPPDWSAYTASADRYLGRPMFKGTPLKGDMLTAAASNTHARTGIHVPLNLALAQAQFETHMGTKGRNPLTNPFNIGEWDAGTVRMFPATQAGVQAYYDSMANKYLTKGRTVNDLLKNFTWASDPKMRYARDPLYEAKLRKQISYINRFLSQGR